MINVISIFANWYSGATLFSIILNQHSALTCNGETFPWGHEKRLLYNCSCGKKITECSYYNIACKHMVGEDRFNIYDRNLFRMLPRFSDHESINRLMNSMRLPSQINELLYKLRPHYRLELEKYLYAHEQFMLNALAYESTSIYIDGTKSIKRAELLSKRKNIKLKAIFLIRDSRGFVNSWLKHKKIQSNKKNISSAINIWINYITRVDQFMKRNTDVSLYVLRYEDLCNNTRRAINDVCDYIGVPYEETMLAAGPYKYHIIGNMMRIGFNGNIIEDVTWRDMLTPDCITYITDSTLRDLVKYGYIN